jgi:hypothetical protein
VVQVVQLGCGVQVPAAPVRLHAMHAPEQAVLQQTPSTQNPLAQRTLEVHAAPSGATGWQVPLSHTFPDAQSELAVQTVLHLPLPHVYGEQLWDTGVWQLPAPSQADAPVNVEPEQLAAPHVVPAGRAEQVPTTPGRLHATQDPVQVVLQQIAPTQLPLAHPAPLPQAAPSGEPSRAAQRIAASTRLCPLPFSAVEVVSFRKNPTRRSGAVNPTMAAPFS